jgi:hypothetical protein
VCSRDDPGPGAGAGVVMDRLGPPEVWGWSTYPGSTERTWIVLDGPPSPARFLSLGSWRRVCSRTPVHRKWRNPVTYRWITRPFVHNPQGETT